MELDWFTVAAQIGNFLLLMWLLRRFLYRPILDAMAARQQRVTAALTEAESKAAAAEALQHDCLARERVLAASREAWLTETRDEVATQRQAWLAEARAEVDEARARWRAELHREQQDCRQSLQQEAGARLLALARRALHDLADTELEASMVPALLSRIQALDDENRQVLARAARDGLTIVTSFPLPAPQQQHMETGLRRLLAPDLVAAFRVDPAAPFGIALETPTRRLTWTLDAYLDGFAAQWQALVARTGTTPP